jgi:molybdopterin molybdotransferase
MQKQEIPAFEEARRIILESALEMKSERVELLSALGRVLAQDVIAPWNLPRFTNSAMDGFAVRLEDCASGQQLPVAGSVVAGGAPVERIEPGTCIRIMTGAPVPDGCDTVIPIENAVSENGFMKPIGPVKRGQHIRVAGEDVREGETVLAAGKLVRSYEINLLASLGKAQVDVFQVPRVAILATGDELVELGETPGPGQVVNSNLYSLASAVRELGAIPVMLGIARDNYASHREKLAEGLKADVLITSAGVSVGDRDFVREVLEELGVKVVFWRVKVKPGKAMAFGVRDGKSIFALPGNPVSSMLTFEEFVAPALLKMMGHKTTTKKMFPAVLQNDLTKKKGQTALLRVKLEYTNGRYLAWSAGKQDSGIQKTMVEANAIAVLPAESESFTAGEDVQVHLLGGVSGA